MNLYLIPRENSADIELSTDLYEANTIEEASMYCDIRGYISLEYSDLSKLIKQWKLRYGDIILTQYGNTFLPFRVKNPSNSCVTVESVFAIDLLSVDIPNNQLLKKTYAPECYTGYLGSYVRTVLNDDRFLGMFDKKFLHHIRKRQYNFLFNDKFWVASLDQLRMWNQLDFNLNNTYKFNYQSLIKKGIWSTRSITSKQYTNVPYILRSNEVAHTQDLKYHPASLTNNRFDVIGLDGRLSCDREDGYTKYYVAPCCGIC